MLGWRILSYLLPLSSVGSVSLLVDVVDVEVVIIDVGVNVEPIDSRSVVLMKV